MHYSSWKLSVVRVMSLGFQQNSQDLIFSQISEAIETLTLIWRGYTWKQLWKWFCYLVQFFFSYYPFLFYVYKLPEINRAVCGSNYSKSLIRSRTQIIIYFLVFSTLLLKGWFNFAVHSTKYSRAYIYTRNRIFIFSKICLPFSKSKC